MTGNYLALSRRFVLPALLNLGYTFTLWVVLAYIPLYLTDLDFSHLQISILIAIFPLASLILMIPFGVSSDRLPPGRLVTAGLILFAIFLAGLRQADSFTPLLFVFIIGGIGGSLFQISCRSLYYKDLGEGNHGKKLGFFLGIGLFGYGFGPLTGGYLFSGFGMDTLLWTAFLIILPFIFLSLFLNNVKIAKSGLDDYKKDVARKEVFILVAITFVVALHVGVEQTCLSLFLREDIGLSTASIGMMFLYIGIAVAIMVIVNGFLSDRLTGRGLGLGIFLYLGICLSGLFNINLLFVSAFSTVLAMRMFHIMGDSLYHIGRMVIISNLFQRGRIGGNLGLIETTATVGTFAGAIMSGLLPGYLLPFVVAGLLSVLVIPPAIAARPKF